MARHPDVQYIRFQTDGNAARKIEVAAPIKTIRLPRVKQKRKRITLRIDPLALTAIVMTVVMAVLMVVGVQRLEEAKQKTEVMQTHVENLQKERAELSQYFRDHCNLEEVERAALALGMVPKEQVPHITIDVSGTQTTQRLDAWHQFATVLASLFA